MKTTLLALVVAVLPLAALAEDPAMLAAERQAIAAVLDGSLSADGPPPRLRERLAANERTLTLTVKRDHDLRTEMAGRKVKMDALTKFLAENPGAMRAPRDQVQLMRLSHQNELTQNVLNALAPTRKRLTGDVARDRALLLSAESGRPALEKRLLELAAP